MAITLRFYDDPGLTTPHAGNLVVNQASDQSTGPVDNVLYLGSTTSGRTFEVQGLGQGVDNIELSVVDADGPGTGQAGTAIKLALTQGGLATAVAGDPLDLGTASFSSGAGTNFIEVWIRIVATNFSVGTYTDLSFQTQTLVEF